MGVKSLDHLEAGSVQFTFGEGLGLRTPELGPSQGGFASELFTWVTGSDVSWEVCLSLGLDVGAALFFIRFLYRRVFKFFS